MILNEEEYEKNIEEYEYNYFMKVKNYIQDRFSDFSFLFVLESWNMGNQGMTYVKNKGNMDLDHYETWISVYPIYHNCYLTIENNMQVLSACSCLLSSHVNNGKVVLQFNDKCIYQLIEQVKDIIDDIASCDTNIIVPHLNDEFCKNAKFLS